MMARFGLAFGAFLLACLSAGAAEDPSVLFRADYDTYSAAADFAHGSKTTADFAEGLMMRMFNGPGGKGNALMLTSGEKVRYAAADNVNPKEGSVSFWVCTQDWKASVENPRWFLTVAAKGLSLRIGKASPATLFGAFYTWDGAPSKDKTDIVCGVLKDAEWGDGVWHRFDVNWSPKGMQLFLDGLPPPVRSVPNRYTNADSARGRRWTAMPEKLTAGTITLGGAEKGETVFIDGLVIRDRPLSLYEVQQAFTAHYPLRNGAAVVEPPRPPRSFDETPYKLRAGVDRTVPEPWTPIRRLGEETFGVLLRDYAFDKGPFPTAVSVEGESVLVKPPVLGIKTAVGADAVAWSPAKVVEVGEDKVTLTGTGTGNGLDFSWKGELWFDGAYVLELSAAPTVGGSGAHGVRPLPCRDGSNTENGSDAVDGSGVVGGAPRAPRGVVGGGLSIEHMDLSWTVPAAHSKYLLTNRNDGKGDVTVQWTNAYDRALVTYRGETLLWLTGPRKGFLWWVDSPANFVMPADGKPVHLRRQANGDVEARVEYIAKPATLTKKATWRFVFQATPTRVPPKDYRDFRYGERCNLTPHMNATTCGWTTFHDWLADEDQTHCSSLLPRDPSVYGRALAQLHRHNNCRILPYNFPGAVGNTDPEWDTKLDEWRMIPSRIHKKKKGKDANAYVWENRECCGHTGVADLHAYRFEQNLQRYGTNGYAGVYFDLCDPYTCENEVHGCGGTDAFGQPYATCNVLHLREYLMRIYKIAHRYNAVVMNHAHNYFNPLCHGFSDYWFPGENHHRGMEKDPEWFYVDGLSNYELECAWNPVIKGVGIQQLGRHDKTPLVKGHADVEHTIRAMAQMLPYDVQVSHGKLDHNVVDKLWGIYDDVKLQAATFRGYWESSDKLTDNPRLRASLYEWKKGEGPYRSLIAASNASHEPQKGLKLPAGVSPQAMLVDLWNNKPIEASRFGDYEIPGGHFALIGIKE